MRDSETNDAIAFDHLIASDDVYAVFDRASVNVFFLESALVRDAAVNGVDDDDDDRVVDGAVVVVIVCDLIDP